MSFFENRLAVSCKQLGEASAELLEWIDENEALVTTERVSLLREFYRAGAGAQRLAAAVHTMSCVAVAGPRRSGKTQLVSALVERGNAPLALRFDGIQDSIAFARQIVPEGGRLGTSAVIRLSAKSRPTPQNFPIVVRLMPMADLVKVIGGAFIKAAPDRAGRSPGIAHVHKLLAEIEQRFSASPVAGLREDDVWEIRDHFVTRFVDEPVLRVLSAAGFWEFLAEHCARITNADRGRLFSLIWGEQATFTGMFVLLADALGRLGFGREASCALDSIVGLDQRTGRFVRRTDSIIAAQTLTGLLDASEQAIVVRTELGQWVSLSRPVMAALVSEVRLPVKGYASELLEKADLIEMPAIEPREAIPGLDAALLQDRVLPVQLFMLAKAVMLMERYTADSEITSLVVTVDPGARKLGELPRLVDDWVGRTHGSDPAEREPNDTGLFVVFTKLDRELTDPVRRGKERRVDIAGRIAGIVAGEFGREHGWPLEWTPGRPFDNVHLVRNPGGKLKHLCDYDNAGRETGYRSSVQARLEAARIDFLKSDIAANHAQDPAAVWNEALELNDGGMTYLAQSIADVCDMRVKHRQVLSSLTGLRQAMKDRLQRYYVSDNPAVQQSRRHGAALQVVRRIRKSAEDGHLGPLIRALQASEAEFADVLSKVAELRDCEDHELDAESEAGEAVELARAAVTHWIEAMRASATAANASRRFKLPQTALLNLVDELIVGAARVGLERMVADRIEMAAGNDDDAGRRVAVAAVCAASIIGEYMMWLGFTNSRSNSRPRRKGKSETPIFPPRREIDPSRVGAETEPSDERFHSDWAQAFMTLVSENAADLRERDLNADQNRRLGQLLMLLDTSI